MSNQCMFRKKVTRSFDVQKPMMKTTSGWSCAFYPIASEMGGVGPTCPYKKGEVAQKKCKNYENKTG